MPAQLDKAHCWHPFTPQGEWCAPGHDPLMIVRAEGVWLHDAEGGRYLDGNSSIWTNIHGHCRPEIAAAIAEQAATLDHSSYLGLGHPLASELAAKLVSYFPANSLERVFFSDNGSTAVEAALKMSLQSRMQTGEEKRTRFLAFDNAYHGDTLGAASLGGVNRFFSRFRSYGFETEFLSSLHVLESTDPSTVTAVVIEPLIQGVNEMRPWPPGMLAQLGAWTSANGIHLILDEVMTGFGRTGAMFACQRENVIPDFLCLAKGLTGGTVPLAATLTTDAVYRTFLGGRENAFYYGHSYTANPIGCAAALASLDLFETDRTLESMPEKIAALAGSLAALRKHPAVKEIRQCGLIAGIELHDGMGETAATAARRHGLVTRNILNTIVLMPPLCITPDEIRFACEAIGKGIAFAHDRISHPIHPEE
ncbi:adenosylmethionine--8-amino-7-oxononanoate transaminase [Akkermansiaceae bacterium]|nr:adenosylmethionine--8-amino-7-oxononanoate transaminase [Akkermansiaceae bacterium]